MKKLINYNDHIIRQDKTLLHAIKQLDDIGIDLTLFVVNESGKLIGTLTDGDIRRSLIYKNLNLGDKVYYAMEKKYRYLTDSIINFEKFKLFKKQKITLIPVVNSKKEIITILNLNNLISILPLDVVIMAGGKGTRLLPLTSNLPKPLLKVGDKSILEHNLLYLSKYGINNFYISVNYLGDKIKKLIKNGEKLGFNVNYINEKKSLGTIGSVVLNQNYKYQNLLVINSDILSNINFEELFEEHIKDNAMMTIVSIPYQLNIPYATLETERKNIKSFKEKPNLSFQINSGVYLLNKKVLRYIPKNKFFNATDLIQTLIDNNKKIIYYPHYGYWIDIGKHDDYVKANKDIKYIKFY